MKIQILLAMHGSPPNDFPRDELTEFFRLNAQMEHMPKEKAVSFKKRYSELDSKMRNWPRSEKNDPFHKGARDMAEHLIKVTGYDVIIGYNEFCSPSLDEAFDISAKKKADRVIVITPMMTRGGEHSEQDIPQAIKRSQEKYPDMNVVYAWPFEITDVAEFLGSQINKFI